MIDPLIQKQIESLLASKTKIEERLRRIEEQLNGEKDNEDTWAGHEGSAQQNLESDRDLYQLRLADINQQLRELGHTVNATKGI